MLELARLYLTLDEVDACQEQCSVILKSDQFNEDATLVCSDSLPLLLIIKPSEDNLLTLYLLYVCP